MTGTSRRRRVGLIIAVLTGVPLFVLLLAMVVVVAVTLSGAPIDASRWRDTVAQRASAALGRPVILQGALELQPTLSREIVVRVGSLKILNPSGFTGQEFIAIGELRARVDLFEALRGGLRSSGIEARDVDLRLERGADGIGNWMPSPRPDSRSHRPAIDLARIVVLKADIHYHDARSATRHVVALEELAASGGRAQPLRLAARGRLEPGLAYAISIEGGPLQQLQDDAEAWPFALEAGTQGARMHARGVLDAGRRTARLQVDARAEDLAPIERVMGAPQPHFGAASIQCAVSIAADSVQVSDLHVRLGESDVSGQLALALGGARPRLTGTLSAAVVDLRPFLAAPPPARGQGSGNRTSVQQGLPLRDLAALDADVELKVERWLGAPVDIRDARLAWRADGRGVRVPMRATIAAVPITGNLELDTAAPTPTVALQVGADNAVLGGPGQGFGLAPRIEGRVGRVRLRMEGRGETSAALSQDLRLSLALAGARLRYSGAADTGPIDVSIDALALAARRGERLRGHARGSLLGERATLTFRGGNIADMLRERVLPLELGLALARSRLRLEGSLALAGSTADTAMRFEFQASRAGDLARWLPVAPLATLPVALRGRLRVADTTWTLDDTTLELGRSRLTVDARSAPVAGRARIVASMRSPLIDGQELSTLRAGPADARAHPRSSPRTFPAGVAAADADVDLRVQRLRLGRTDLEDLVFVAHARDGRLMPSSVTGTIAGAAFSANVEMDPHARPPMARLGLTAGAVDLGALLRGLGLAEDIDGQAQAVEVDLQAHGSNPAEWIRHSAVDVRIRGGSLAIRGAAASTVADIRVDQVRVGASAGEPLRARLEGEIGQTPLRLEVTSGTLAEFAGDAARVPFALTARSAGAELALDGDISLPFGSGGQLNMHLRGERLDSLSGLARVELPAWGPWSLSSPIRVTPTGYELPSLHIAVGQSQLDGTAKLDLSRPRPYLDLQLTAPSVQLDDFPLPERLSERPDDGRNLRQAASRVAGRTDTLLSAAFLRRVDATIDVKAKEVLSGTDRLADGSLRVTLDGGRLHLDPVVVNIPGGAMRLSISYELSEGDAELGMAARVDRFDYGIIARRFNRTAHMRGSLSLDMALFGKAPTLENITRNASGRVDFAVWPVELSGEAFNLWSVNLLLQLLPLIDPNTRPTVNCIVGRFDLEHGDLRHDKMLIDTSAVRVSGAGHANLATEQLDFVFRPRAKGFAVFRLQTPLRVTGTLDDRRFGFTPTDVFASALRLIASPVLLPIERLTLGPLPRDGADVCTDPLRAIER